MQNIEAKLPSEYENGIVHLVTGTDKKGQDFYAYISIHYAQYESFFQDVQTGKIDLTSYGDILESGFGEEPPSVVMKQVEKKFGIDHHLIKKLNLKEKIRTTAAKKRKNH